MGTSAASAGAVIDGTEARRDHGFHLVEVKAVVDETHDTRSYVLAIPDDLRDSFGYRAGQFCTFRTRIDGEELLRCVRTARRDKRRATGDEANWRATKGR
jgi:3-ketosteroid 9alpha-monooxygenase subunit B